MKLQRTCVECFHKGRRSRFLYCAEYKFFRRIGGTCCLHLSEPSSHWRLRQLFPPKRHKNLILIYYDLSQCFQARHRLRDVCVIIIRLCHCLMFSCLVYVFALSVRLFSCQTSYTTVTSIRKKMQVEGVLGVLYKPGGFFFFPSWSWIMSVERSAVRSH